MNMKKIMNSESTTIRKRNLVTDYSTNPESVYDSPIKT